MSTQLLSVMIIFAGVCVADPPEKTEYTDADIQSSLKAGDSHQPTASPDTPGRSSSGFCGMT